MLPDTFSLISCYFPAHAHLFACFLGLLVITVYLRHVVDVVVVANTFGLDRVLKVVSVVKQMFRNTCIWSCQHKRTRLVFLLRHRLKQVALRRVKVLGHLELT